MVATAAVVQSIEAVTDMDGAGGPGVDGGIQRQLLLTTVTQSCRCLKITWRARGARPNGTKSLLGSQTVCVDTSQHTDPVRKERNDDFLERHHFKVSTTSLQLR